MARARRKSKPETPQEDYARAVVAGDVVAGKLVRLACERHLDDLERGHERGIYWDQEAADYACGFFPLFLRHFKGDFGRPWPGQKFVLEPWQLFVIGVFFGWRMAVDGRRRFRVMFLSVARKNGKSPIAAGIALFCLWADDEPGAEVFMAATHRAQVKKVTFHYAKEFVKRSSTLRAELEVLANNINDPSTASSLDILGADGDKMDGFSPYCAIVDELHQHPNRKIWDAMESGQGARQEPVLVGTTTAGEYNPEGIGWELHSYGQKVLERAVQDDTYFPYIAQLDEADKWSDEANWIKANPNLGVSVSEDYMRAKCQKALATPGFVTTFRRFHCNQWVNAAKGWLDMNLWLKCGGPLELDLTGQRCFAGIDLGRKNDPTSVGLWFPEHRCSLSWYWIAEDSIPERRSEGVDWSRWVADKLVRTTPGAAVDFDYVEDAVVRICETFEVQGIAYDPKHAGQLVTNLENQGIEMVRWGQTWDHMSPATTYLERRVERGEYSHGDDPVLTWMASNVVPKISPEGYLRPDKAKSTDRIDGIVALLMAIGLWIKADDGGLYSDELLEDLEDEGGSSLYVEDRGGGLYSDDEDPDDDGGLYG